MGGLFSKPKAPVAAPVAPPPPPAIDTPAVQAASDATRIRERKARGQASTLLTGSGGLTDTTAQIGTKKLLGS